MQSIENKILLYPFIFISLRSINFLRRFCLSADTLAKEIATYLLSINQHKEWMDRLSSFGVIGFAENSADYYNLNDVKSVLTSVPYY